MSKNPILAVDVAHLATLAIVPVMGIPSQIQ